jgi:hypothetical protein
MKFVRTFPERFFDQAGRDFDVSSLAVHGGSCLREGLLCMRSEKRGSSILKNVEAGLMNNVSLTRFQ